MSMETSPNFTPKCQRIIADSKNLAESLSHEEVNCGHLLVSMLSSDASFINDLVRGFNLKIDSFIEFIEAFYFFEEAISDSPESYFGEDIKELLTKSHEFAKKIQNSYIGPEHLFFSFLNDSNGVCSHFFYAHNVSPSKILEAFLILFDEQQAFSREPIQNDDKEEGGAAIQRKPQADPNSMLESFCTNLNELNHKGSLGKIIGKDAEVDRICEILGRKIKNNPLLVGEPGVGKTAVVEGLVQRIGQNKVPPFLFGKKIYSVDLASMIAGTKYRGQFEKRLKDLILECSQDKDIVLFIDEIHTIVGAGSAEGAMDAANMLKPSLARGDLTVIGATTFSEYKKNIERDIALVRRFENVMVEEPSPNECLLILKGIKASYEKFHGVKYSISVLKKIVSLCEDYLPNKNFPDKAIDVLDECGAKLKIKNTTPSKEMMKIESQIYDLSAQATNSSIEDALIDEYTKLGDKWEDGFRQNVCEDDVLECLSAKTKLPKENFENSKDEKLVSLGRKLNRDVVNQKDAVSDIHKSILRFKLGLKDMNKPIGSFLCLGASGVGKTWTAKMIAKHYFGSEKNILRFDMSEYSDKVSSSKLTGASPGYVGYEEGGVLIEAIKKKPHCVLLFDEVEKSHPEVQQLLLQILEEGELEDNSGTKVYFKDTIIILTSNIGSDLTTKSSLGFSPIPVSNDVKIHDLAKKILSPELVNRLDSVIVFNHLKQDHLLKIFKSEIRKLSSKLRSKKIKLIINSEAAEFICKQASKEKMGARPLKRLIKSNIEDKIVEHYFNNQEEKELKFNFLLQEEQVIYNID